MEEVAHSAAIGAPLSNVAERFFDLTGDLLAVVTNEGKIVRVNATFSALTQIPAVEAVDQPLGTVLKLSDPLALSDAIARLRLGETSANFELEVHLGPKPSIFAATLHADQDTWYFVAHDISERRRLAGELQGRDGDKLSGLSNKSAFQDALELELKMSASAAVVLIRLVELEFIQNEHGEALTHELLQAAVSRIRRNLRTSDLMARWSANEFTIVIAGDDVSPSARRMGDQMVESLKRTFGVKGIRIEVQSAVGVSIGSSASHTMPSLLEQASAAASKAALKGETAAFTIQSDTPSAATTTGDSGFTNPSDLAVFVGGIFRTDGSGAMGLELFRAEKQSAMERLAASNSLDMIESFTLDAVNDALYRIGPWLAAHPTRRLGLNLSDEQVRSPMLFSQLASAATGAGIAADQIVIEIEESDLLRSAKGSQELVSTIRRSGLRIAVDHFGANMAALGLLETYDISYVKLDPSIAQTMFTSAYRAALVRSIQATAAATNVEVIATGVVHEDQLKALRTVGCAFVQGQFIHAPEDVQAFAAKVGAN